MSTFKTSLIASVAYRTGIIDRSLLDILLKKGVQNVKTTTIQDGEFDENGVAFNQPRREVSRGTSNSSRKQAKIWEDDKKYPDTSVMYRRNYSHLGLRSRISRNSGGALPLPIRYLKSEEIAEQDRSTIKTYLTPSGSCRKCSLTVLSTAGWMAIKSICGFKDNSVRPYLCKPIHVSVKELSKNTNAGADTLGRKNDPEVQKRVIKQVNAVFKRPTSYKLFKNNVKLFNRSNLKKLFDLPEIIFHRFQVLYDKISNIDVEKCRIVWCVPYTIVAIENIFFGEMIDSAKIKAQTSSEVLYPLGLTNYLIGQRSVKTLRDRFRRIENKDYKIYSLDFSKYDSTIPNWVKDIFFAITKLLVTMNENQEKVFDYLRVYIKYTPFVNKDKVMTKRKGISSGLFITNFFDTFWNLTIHYLVMILKTFYPEQTDQIYNEKIKSFNDLDFDVSPMKREFIYSEPWVRVMGDDSIILCDEYTLFLHRKICSLFGMKVTIKHVTENPEDEIFFLGRFWNSSNRPFQTEHYMALRIHYTKWFDDKNLPFDLKDLHLNRILSICLPLVGGKEFLDKYLFDYEPYLNFKRSKRGFIYMKEFIEENFKFIDYNRSFDVDSY